jgi:DNA-binding XRE family transcriptional regulator
MDVRHETRDGVEVAVLPRAELEALLERLEDAEDTVAGLQVLLRRARGEEEAFPADLLREMRAPGASRVALMRRHRGLSQEALAEAAGTSRAYVSQIETGHRGAGAELRRAIARALAADPDLLWPPPGGEAERVA